MKAGLIGTEGRLGSKAYQKWTSVSCSTFLLAPSNVKTRTKQKKVGKFFQYILVITFICYLCVDMFLLMSLNFPPYSPLSFNSSHVFSSNVLLDFGH